MDKILVGRPWRTVQYEDIYLKEYVSVPALDSYVTFYNTEPSHQSLGNRTLAEVQIVCRGALC